MNFHALHATVMGLGQFGGGAAAARYLARAGAVVTVTDLASEKTLAKSLKSLQNEHIVRYVLGEHREDDFRQADLIVVNPAVRPDNPWLEIAQAAGARLTSEMELFLGACPAHVVGVTGTNGKSTTTAMIAAILQAAGHRTFLGGNIGRSLLDVVDTMAPTDYAVVEISSFQLHRLSQTARLPQTAVVTNFSPNHLDWHGTLDHYRQAKQRLLQSPDSTALFDRAAPGLADWVPHVQGRHIHPAAELPPLALPGRHNETNACLAAATAESLGCPPDAVKRGLTSFRALPDRLEPLATVDGRRFINDSSSTTPESTVAALLSLDGPVWLLVGGADKGLDFSLLIKTIAQHASGVVCYGRVRQTLADSLTSHVVDFPCHCAETLDQAFSICTGHAPHGATVLLSPACSSHDQFTNYRHRGVAFSDLVEALARRRDSSLRDVAEE